MSEAGHTLADGLEINTSACQGSRGITWELCAGIVDKDAPVEEIAACEV